MKPLVLSFGLCLAASAAAAQGAYIRPLAPPPTLPGHGFFISEIEMVPENFTGGAETYTAHIQIQVRDLPGFVSKSEPIVLDIKHVKPNETMQQIRKEAADLVDKQIDLIIKTLQDYKSDFDKNRQ